MHPASVQPTAPIGGHAARGTPDGPQGLGQRESVRAVLSTMLETSGVTGGVPAGGEGINLHSGMSQLVDFPRGCIVALSTLHQGSGLRSRLGSAGKICRYFQLNLMDLG